MSSYPVFIRPASQVGGWFHLSFWLNFVLASSLLWKFLYLLKCPLVFNGREIVAYFSMRSLTTCFWSKTSHASSYPTSEVNIFFFFLCYPQGKMWQKDVWLQPVGFDQPPCCLGHVKSGTRRQVLSKWVALSWKSDTVLILPSIFGPWCLCCIYVILLSKMLLLYFSFKTEWCWWR